MSNYQHEYIVTSQSMCAPAARMAVAHAWIIDGKLEYTLYPVLAIISKSGMEFMRKRRIGDWHSPEISPKRMEEAGWELSENFNRIAAVFDEPEYGMIADDDEVLPCVNSAYGRVAFAWGEDGKEDASRVQPVIENLRLIIQDKLEREAADKLKKATMPTNAPA